MRKGDDGIWSATIGPLDPEMYVYYFTVDGVRLTDPSNPQVKIGYVTSTTTSLVTVPGDTPAFYDVQDVPHGEIRTLLYKSRSNGVTRELTVYVPPGYDEARNQRYPVLYLLHGFANDHHSWHRYGRANDILDNLLARKDQAVPRRHAAGLWRGARQRRRHGHRARRRASGGDAALYERDLLEDVIPMIDSKYRTRPTASTARSSASRWEAGRPAVSGCGISKRSARSGIMSAGMARRRRHGAD